MKTFSFVIFETFGSYENIFVFFFDLIHTNGEIFYTILFLKRLKFVKMLSDHPKLYHRYFAKQYLRKIRSLQSMVWIPPPPGTNKKLTLPRVLQQKAPFFRNFTFPFTLLFKVLSFSQTFHPLPFRQIYTDYRGGLVPP